jgi:hypothetical protein
MNATAFNWRAGFGVPLAWKVRPSAEAPPISASSLANNSLCVAQISVASLACRVNDQSATMVAEVGALGFVAISVVREVDGLVMERLVRRIP